MKKVVLLGAPVAHSFSPTIQNAAFKEADLDWRYQALEIAPGNLGATLARMREEGWPGANVTIPFKEAVSPLLDEIDPSADRTSAVNTIVNNNGHLVGHNTDLRGFMTDLKAHWQVPSAGPSLILGAGGAARAVAFGLAGEGLDLTFIARSSGRAERLAEDVRRGGAADVATLPWAREFFVNSSSQCILVVNATPLGMMPNIRKSPWPDDLPLPPDAFVYDLVYSPPETRLVQQAHQSGIEAVSGAGMLLEQAALSFELWTGQTAPRERMRAALGKALGRSSAWGKLAGQPNRREVLDA
ncbi:MAG: shikimate dehydrogenase [Chloroflexi bacterium]|nr:shikimate dehydrogenase [Chloroflexota bacterium]MCH8875828.1 shikimate dehydrogenase [Chloroflexota bacterium]MCI0771795.1 shikimate dehydrogenase [Chloroflexota bacterium]MCI0806106.1 shikimate dehydrogenase [Chloroflexota bacterium]MCI0826217.1 shikimate dehydrogenase [Chloroflexota bacterium]